MNDIPDVNQKYKGIGIEGGLLYMLDTVRTKDIAEACSMSLSTISKWKKTIRGKISLLTTQEKAPQRPSRPKRSEKGTPSPSRSIEERFWKDFNSFHENVDIKSRIRRDKKSEKPQKRRARKIPGYGKEEQYSISRVAVITEKTLPLVKRIIKDHGIECEAIPGRTRRLYSEAAVEQIQMLNPRKISGAEIRACFRYDKSRILRLWDFIRECQNIPKMKNEYCEIIDTVTTHEKNKCYYFDSELVIKLYELKGLFEEYGDGRRTAKKIQSIRRKKRAL